MDNVFSHQDDQDSSSPAFSIGPGSNSDQQTSQADGFSHNNRSPSASSPKQRARPFNLQNRRLQLRNAGFRGALLPARRSSPQISAWRAISRESQADENKENSASEINTLSSPRDNTHNTHQRRRSSILQEINNSTQRRYPRSPRPSVTTLFQDQSPSTFSDSSQSSQRGTKHLDPPLELDSPVCVDETEAMMKSTELAYSWKSPFGSLERPKKRQSGGKRMSSRDTSRYIEHLERQLAASLEHSGRADSSASNAQISKLKSLGEEHKILKQELAEWETRFEARVKEEVSDLLEKESQLRTRIRGLERELESKDNRVREQEWELESASQKLRNMESVNSTNRSLERRVDVLTELLAQSPTRTENHLAMDHTFETNLEEDEYHTSRPKSMFSRIPLSPIRKSTIRTLPGPDVESSMPLVNDLHTELTLGNSHNRSASQASNPNLELGSLDSGLGISCSPPSTRSPESHCSSLVSFEPTNSPWGTSLPLSPELKDMHPKRHRKMRRFPPGSVSLKPLVLPTASGTPTSPQHHQRHNSVPQGNSGITLCSATLDENMPQQRDELENLISEHGSRPGSFSTQEGNDFTDNLQGIDSALRGEYSISPPRPILYDEIEPSKRQQHQRKLSEHYELPPVGPIKPTQRFQDRDLTPTVKFGYHNRQSSVIVSPPAAKITRKFMYHFHESVRGYLSIARRILSNAWHSNWNRLGKLSWYIIQFLLGYQARDEWQKNQYEANCIKHQDDDIISLDCLHGDSADRESQAVSSTADPFGLTLLSDDYGNLSRSSESISGQSRVSTQGFHHWPKFCVAVVLAIGFAIKDGPASLMNGYIRRSCCLHNNRDQECSLANSKYSPSRQNEQRGEPIIREPKTSPSEDVAKPEASRS